MATWRHTGHGILKHILCLIRKLNNVAFIKKDIAYELFDSALFRCPTLHNVHASWRSPRRLFIHLRRGLCAIDFFSSPDCDLHFFPYHHKQFNHPEPLASKRKISEISGLRILEEAYNINIISCDNNVWQKASISAYWVKGCGSSIKCLLISERSKHPLKSIRIHMSSTSFIDEVKTVWAYFWARTYLLVY